MNCITLPSADWRAWNLSHVGRGRKIILIIKLKSFWRTSMENLIKVRWKQLYLLLVIKKGFQRSISLPLEPSHPEKSHKITRKLLFKVCVELTAAYGGVEKCFRIWRWRNQQRGSTQKTAETRFLRGEFEAFKCFLNNSQQRNFPLRRDDALKAKI